MTSGFYDPNKLGFRAAAIMMPSVGKGKTVSNRIDFDLDFWQFAIT